MKQRFNKNSQDQKYQMPWQFDSSYANVNRYNRMHNEEIPEFSMQPAGYVLPEVVTSAEFPNLFYTREAEVGPNYVVRSEVFNPTRTDFGDEVGRAIYQTPFGNDTIYFGDPDIDFIRSKTGFLAVPSTGIKQNAYKNKFFNMSKYAYPESSEDDKETLKRIKKERR